MRPEVILYWLRAAPFRPFRIVLVDGKTYDIRHPDFVKVLRTSVVVFEPTAEEQVYERGQMLGLLLVSRIEPIEAATTA